MLQRLQVESSEVVVCVMGKMCEGTSNRRSLNVIQLEKVLEWRITIRDMTIDAVEEDSVGSLVGAGDRNGTGAKSPCICPPFAGAAT